MVGRNKKGILVLICIFFVSTLLMLIFGKQILRLEKVYDYMEDGTEVRFHMKPEITENSYGREMRIVQLKINGKAVELQRFDNEQWVWHGEWGYTLFKDGNMDFVVDKGEYIEQLFIEYVEQEGSGNVEIFIGDRKIDEISMYKQKWYNASNYYVFADKTQKVFKYTEHVVAISAVMFLIYLSIISIVKKKENYGVKSTLGMFDAAKGFSMIVIILGHTIVDVESNIEGMSQNLFFLLLAYLMANGLMPMFYMISGYGFRNEKNGRCIKKQLRFLLKPYIVMAVAAMLCTAVRMAIDNEYTLIEWRNLGLSFLSFNTINSNVRGFELVSVGPIWFCIELCIAWIILNFIFKLKNKKLIFAAVVVIMVLGSLLTNAPYNIYARTQFIPALFFIYVGFLIRDKKIFQKENKFTLLKYIVGVLIIGALSVVNGVCEAASNNMGRYYILGVIICAGMGVVILRVYVTINSKVKLKYFKRIGRVTYDIIYIHSFEYVVIPWKKIMMNVNIPVWSKIVLICVLRCIIIFVIYKLVQYIRSIKKKEISKV